MACTPATSMATSDVRRLLAAMIVASACGGAPPSPTPPAAGPEHAGPTRPAPVVDVPGNAACAAHKRALREEYCDPAATDEPCSTDKFACELGVDFDGDGVLEQVVVEPSGDSITLVAHFSDGGTQDLARVSPPELAGAGDSFADFSWLMHWEVLAQDSGGFYQNIAGTRQKLPVTGADGDALLVSGGDAAALLFSRKGLFVIEELGF